MKKTSKSATPPTPAASASSSTLTSPSAPKKTAAPASVAGTPAQEPRTKAPEPSAPVNPPRAAAPAPQAPSAAASASAKVLKPVKFPVPDKPAASASRTGGSTVIRAKIDVGFGNSLFVRGEGSELSWDKGVPLANTSPDEWVISLREVKHPVQFKLLINDQQWSSGDDYTVAPGASVTLSPTF